MYLISNWFSFRLERNLPDIFEAQIKLKQEEKAVTSNKAQVKSVENEDEKKEEDLDLKEEETEEQDSSKKGR